MEITFQHVCSPCEYLIFDDVCSPEELQNCFLEAQLLSAAFKDPKETGSAIEQDGTLKKKNKGIFLQEVYHPNFSIHSPTTQVINKVFNTVRNGNYTPLSYMRYLKNMSGYNVLLSAYKNEDYYLSHQDTSVLTLIFWFGEDSITGGDLVFSDFDHTVLFKKNRAIIFPSHYEHQVTEIKTNLDGYVRFSATAFLVKDGIITPQQPTTVGTNDF